MSRFKGTKGMLILIVLVCAVIGYYYYIANKGADTLPKEEYVEGTSTQNGVNEEGDAKNKFWKSTLKEEEPVEITPVQNVLLRNLETNYPPTPKEVVKYFAEITRCFYSEKYTEEELEQLAVKIQQIYDEDLVKAKEQDKYIQDLKDDIKKFKDKKYVITGFYTSSSVDVEEFKESGHDWARLYCTFYITVNKKTNVKSQQKILLRKDAEGHWKIYGWDLVE